MRESADVRFSAFRMFLPVVDFLFDILRFLYPLARCTRTRVSLSHWLILSIMNSLIAGSDCDVSGDDIGECICGSALM